MTTAPWKTTLLARHIDAETAHRTAIEDMLTAAPDQMTSDRIHIVDRLISWIKADAKTLPIAGAVTRLLAFSTHRYTELRWQVIDQIPQGDIPTLRDMITTLPGPLRAGVFTTKDIEAARISVLAEHVLTSANGDWDLFCRLTQTNGFDSPEQAWKMVPVDQRVDFVNGGKRRMLEAARKGAQFFSGGPSANAEFWNRLLAQVQNLDFPTWEHFCNAVPSHTHTTLGISATTAAPNKRREPITIDSDDVFVEASTVSGDSSIADWR
ncbi:hypothetical protein HON52_03490 [Candidatus Uhrbacteria bacterium]|jgi:hypothetical protein|nr:hypothetical protein [Candidatus Uhrbacteria bacterium]